MAAQPSQIDSAIRSRFVVRDSFQLPDGEVEYKVEYTPDSKMRFEELHAELASRGLTPALVGTREDTALMIRKKQPLAPSRSRVPVILALLTLASVVVFAIFQRVSYQHFAPDFPGNVVFLTYAGAVVVVLAAHELGHRYLSLRSRTAPPLPYFIPGIPDVTAFLPALGAISRQREPAVNRDRMFDTMIIGPFLAFVAAVLIYALGGFFSVQSSLPIHGCQYVDTIEFCTINNSVVQTALDWLTGPFTPNIASGFVRFSPLQDGASVGFLLTFIGLLPMASFDGGHLFSLGWGAKGTRLATYLSVFALIALDTPNYWALAIVVLLVAGRPAVPRVLDEVSSISRSRRWLYLGALALAFLSIPVPQTLAFLPL